MENVENASRFIEWIAHAVRQVLSIRSGGRQAIEPGAAIVGLKSRHFERSPDIGPHRHALAEVCLALRGQAALQVDGRLFRLHPPGLAVLAPGSLHCEGRLRARQGYCLMWVIPAMTGHCGLHVSRYDPATGWPAPSCLHFDSSGASMLLECLRGLPADGAARLETLRPYLLAVLGQAMAQALRQLREARASHNQPSRAAVVGQVQEFLQTNLHQRITVASVARMLSLSEDYLNRLFRSQTGIPLHAFLTRKRMEAARKLCEESSLPIKQIALGLGYDDPLYFSRAFAKFYGLSPSQARLEGASPRRA